ncbi:MAG TPA: MBL fold metallo-hydrolase [Actinomycetota bacterium]
MTLSLTVLGSSAMYATLERACSGYLVEVGGRRIWMDAGAGAWRNLLQHVDYPDIDAVILSHQHPDHTSDLFQAFHARNYGEASPLPPIPVWGPGATLDAVRAYVPSIEESFELNEVDEGGSVDYAGATFRFTRMAHPVETLGVRVEAGDAVLAYSADSGTEADFDSLATGADLFVCEATFQDSDESWTGHMAASQAAKVAASVGAGRLLLTHLPPGRDLGMSLAEAHAAAEGVPVQLADDGQRFEVGS